MLREIAEGFGAVKVKKADKMYEITKILLKNEGKPVIIEDVDGYGVLGNLYSSRKSIADWFGVSENKLLEIIWKGVKKGRKPESGEFRLRKTNFSLTELPIPKFYPRDGGNYFTSSVVIAERNGKRNLSYHRIMVLDEERGAIRLVERDLYRMWRDAVEHGEELKVAVCVGLEPTFALAAATSVEWERDESDIASAMRFLSKKEREKIAATPFRIKVPVNAEIVFEARIIGDTVEKEGPFVDITGTYDVQKNQPIIVFENMYAVKDFLFHAILPAGYEHKNLMGMPREGLIYGKIKDAGIDVKGVRLTPGGSSWLHAVISIKKRKEEDARVAIQKAFEAHRSLKHAVVVDDDIDINNLEDVEWAIATRFQAKLDLVVKEERGSSLDPSRFSGNLTTKVGIDATKPLGRDYDFKKARFVDFDVFMKRLKENLPEHEMKSSDPYRVLVATVISHRTKDEVTYEVAEKVFEKYPDIHSLAEADEEELASLICPAGFYRQKAKKLKNIARIIVENYGGKIPESMDELLKLPGIGRKTANIIISRSFGKDAIAVDTHVHRISNRLGIVETKTPEETEKALKKVLPRKYWKEFNVTMVLFGRNICRPISPKCDECPVKDMCMRIGV